MSATQFLVDVFRARSSETAIIWRGESYRYSSILDWVEHWKEVLARE